MEDAVEEAVAEEAVTPRAPTTQEQALATYYAALDGSSALPERPAETATLDVQSADTRTVARWSVRSRLPWQQGLRHASDERHQATGLLVSGAYDGIPVWGQTTAAYQHPSAEAPVPYHAADPNSWQLVTGESSLRLASFIAGGSRFSRSELRAARYGPGMANPWGLRDRAHIADIQFVGSVIVSASVNEHESVSPNSLLLALAARFNARADAQVRALDRLLRAHGAQVTHRDVWLYPAFDSAAGTLRVLFYRAATGRPSPSRDSPCVGEASDANAMVRAEVAIEYTTTLDGVLLEEIRFRPRADASWDRPDPFGRFQPYNPTSSRRELAQGSERIQARSVVTRTHDDWDENENENEAAGSGSEDRTLWFDVSAMTWYGDETWWPTEPISEGVAHPNFEGPLQVLQLVEDVDGEPHAVEGSERLPGLLLALRERFTGEVRRRRRSIDAQRRRVALARCGGAPWVTVRASPSWDSASERLHVRFDARFEQRAIVAYSGGIRRRPGATSESSWYSEFAVEYEIDVDGVLYAQDIYPPRSEDAPRQPRP